MKNSLALPEIGQWPIHSTLNVEIVPRIVWTRVFDDSRFGGLWAIVIGLCFI
jgi:hypothetical protein